MIIIIVDFCNFLYASKSRDQVPEFFETSNESILKR